MAREFSKACSKFINAGGNMVENVSNIVDTLSKRFSASSKIELAEDLQESSVPGNTLKEKAQTAKQVWEDLM